MLDVRLKINGILIERIEGQLAVTDKGFSVNVDSVDARDIRILGFELNPSPDHGDNDCLVVSVEADPLDDSQDVRLFIEDGNNSGLLGIDEPKVEPDIGEDHWGMNK